MDVALARLELTSRNHTTKFVKVEENIFCTRSRAELGHSFREASAVQARLTASCGLMGCAARLDRENPSRLWADGCPARPAVRFSGLDIWACPFWPGSTVNSSTVQPVLFFLKY